MAVQRPFGGRRFGKLRRADGLSKGVILSGFSESKGGEGEKERKEISGAELAQPLSSLG